MNPLRSLARAARASWRRLRFRLWALRLQARLRRAGGRLELHAPHGADFDSPPRLRTPAVGEGSGTLVLRIGRDVSLGHEVVLEVWARGSNELVLGDGARIGDGVRLTLRSGRLRLGARIDVRAYAVLKTEGDLSVGDDAMVGHFGVIHCAERVEIGDRTTLAERTTIADSEHTPDPHHTYNAPVRRAPVTLGTNVFAGAGVVITSGSHVGADAVLAAGAVLAGGDYPAGWVIAGVPARPLNPAESPASSSAAPPAGL
jgi:acetyltransferase-like isoleucine patch superfamily enzyme